MEIVRSDMDEVGLDVEFCAASAAGRGCCGYGWEGLRES